MTYQPDPIRFPIADLELAVYLFTTGHELIKMTLQGAERPTFYCKRTGDSEAHVDLNCQGPLLAKRLWITSGPCGLSPPTVRSSANKFSKEENLTILDMHASYKEFDPGDSSKSITWKRR